MGTTLRTEFVRGSVASLHVLRLWLEFASSFQANCHVLMVMWRDQQVAEGSLARSLPNRVGQQLAVSSQAAKQPSSQAAKQPSSQAAKQPSSQAAKQPSSQAAKQPSSQAAKQPSSQAAKQPSSQAGKQASRQAGKQPATNSQGTKQEQHTTSKYRCSPGATFFKPLANSMLWALHREGRAPNRAFAHSFQDNYVHFARRCKGRSLWKVSA